MAYDPNDPATRAQEVDGILEGIWASVLDEMIQSHEPTRSAYRFAMVFLGRMAIRENLVLHADQSLEETYFNASIFPFLNKLSLSERERLYILATLLERTCASITRPHKPAA